MRARLASILAAAAVALSLTALSAQQASAATVHRLTIVVLDRSGHSSDADVQLLNVAAGLNVNTDLGTSRHRDLRPGVYNVAAWIISGTGTSPTYTLADQLVDLNSNKTVTLDARQGRRVRLSLDNPSAQAELLEFAPLISGQAWAFNPASIDPPVASAYVVPMTSKYMTLYVYSVWEKKGNTVADPSPFRYDIIRVFRGGIPRSPVIRTRTSQLARIDITVRSTDADQQATLALAPEPGGAILPLNATTTLGATPARLVSYRTPGSQWQPVVDWQSQAGTLEDTDLSQPAYGPGRHSELWGAAVLSPRPDAMYGLVSGRSLQAGFYTDGDPLGDPLHDTDQATGITKLLRLYSGSRLLTSGHGDVVSARIPAVLRHYTLTLGVTRSPGALLSTRIDGVWHFTATGGSPGTAVQLFGLRVLPAGLSGRNQAAAGSLTRVGLQIDSAVTGTEVQVALPVVRVWASANDGMTWRRASVHEAGGRYVLSVRNAAAAGFTSLRIYVSDGHGASEELTVIHAYSVR
jgi:hypothetical protein